MVDASNMCWRYVYHTNSMTPSRIAQIPDIGKICAGGMLNALGRKKPRIGKRAVSVSDLYLFFWKVYTRWVSWGISSYREYSRKEWPFIRDSSRKNLLLYETLLVKICFFTRPISLLSRLISAKLFIVRAFSRKVLFFYEADLV